MLKIVRSAINQSDIRVCVIRVSGVTLDEFLCWILHWYENFSRYWFANFESVFYFEVGIPGLQLKLLLQADRPGRLMFVDLISPNCTGQNLYSLTAIIHFTHRFFLHWSTHPSSRWLSRRLWSYEILRDSHF